MSLRRLPLIRWIAFVLTSAFAVSLLVAGDLEPPGPPGPTMKTLEEVECRIPIHAADLPATINQSGSYYLAENVVTNTGGITIAADNVTIDLMGFTLYGGSGTGIKANSDTKNLVVRNGCVTDWGIHGVDLWDATNSQVFDIRSENNVGDGIRVQHGSFVVNSSADGNGMTGIIAWNQSTIQGCVARGNRWGLSINHGSAAIDSVASLSDVNGIDANDASLVRGCTSTANTQDGINVHTDGVVVGNLSHDNGYDGIDVTGPNNRVDGNHVIENDVGIHCGSYGNLFIRNSASDNVSDDYDIQTGNDVGPIGAAATATSPWANLVF